MKQFRYDSSHLKAGRIYAVELSFDGVPFVNSTYELK